MNIPETVNAKAKVAGIVSSCAASTNTNTGAAIDQAINNDMNLSSALCAERSLSPNHSFAVASTFVAIAAEKLEPIFG